MNLVTAGILPTGGPKPWGGGAVHPGVGEGGRGGGGGGVVAAGAGPWRPPPFAGEVHDGALWGRGAVDMKQMVAMSVATVGLLARLGVPLGRELKLAVVADEEAGCAAGSQWLVAPP